MNEKAQIRKRAKAQMAGVLRVSHILPRAYCIAKPCPCHAVFAVPPQDREPQVRDIVQISVQNASAVDVCCGDWASLAYVSLCNGSGSMFVIH